MQIGNIIIIHSKYMNWKNKNCVEDVKILNSDTCLLPHLTWSKFSFPFVFFFAFSHFLRNCMYSATCTWIWPLESETNLMKNLINFLITQSNIHMTSKRETIKFNWVKNRLIIFLVINTRNKKYLISDILSFSRKKNH